MTLHDRRPRAPLFQPLPAALRRALSWRLGFVAAALACVLLLALLSEARAAGGAYRVDDGEIDPVGECNLDAWHQRERHHGNRYQSVLSPACTFSALPSVQLGAALVREGDAGDRHSRLSPELKTPLLARDDLGLALAFALSADLYLDRRHAFEGAGFNLPLSYQPFEALRLNAGVGLGHGHGIPRWPAVDPGRRTLRRVGRRQRLAGRTAAAPGRTAGPRSAGRRPPARRARAMAGLGSDLAFLSPRACRAAARSSTEEAAMNVVRKCLGASRRALCGLAARLLAKAAHLLMVVSVRAYASGRLSQVEVKYLLDCSSALNRASLRLAMGQ